MIAVRRLTTVQGPPPAAVIGVVAGSCYLVAFAWAMRATSFDIWGGLIVAPVLLVLTIPLALSAARAEEMRGSAGW